MAQTTAPRRPRRLGKCETHVGLSVTARIPILPCRAVFPRPRRHSQIVVQVCLLAPHSQSCNQRNKLFFIFWGFLMLYNFFLKKSLNSKRGETKALHT